LDLHTTILDFASEGRVVESADGPGRSMRPLLLGDRTADWRTVQFAEHGYARMVSDGRWKLVRYYQQDREQPPKDIWYDLVHPLGERHDSVAPRQSLQDQLISELEEFFRTYETPEHTGRDVWRQPAPNDWACRDLQGDCQ